MPELSHEERVRLRDAIRSSLRETNHQAVRIKDRLLYVMTQTGLALHSTLHDLEGSVEQMERYVVSLKRTLQQAKTQHDADLR